MLRDYGESFAKLLAVVDAAVLRPLGNVNELSPEAVRAATKLGDFLDQAKSRRLQPPPGYTTFQRRD